MSIPQKNGGGSAIINALSVKELHRAQICCDSYIGYDLVTLIAD